MFPQDLCSNSLSTPVPYAHYTDDRFTKGEVLVFDSKAPRSKENCFNYADRLQGWDSDLYERSEKAATEKLPNSRRDGCGTGEWWQELLRNYHNDQTIQLLRSWTYCSPMDGYQYWAFEYTAPKS